MTADNVIKLIFAILGAILTYAIVPWLRSIKTAQELEMLSENIRIAVQAAEQIITGPGRGTEKKSYVRKWLADRGVNFEDGAVWNEVDAMIESAVLELKREAQ